MRPAKRKVARADSVQHEYFGVLCHGPNVRALGRERDEEISTALGIEDARNVPRADPVRVGLQYRRMRPGRHGAAQRAPIAAKRGQIDCQNRPCRNRHFINSIIVTFASGAMPPKSQLPYFATEANESH